MEKQKRQPNKKRPFHNLNIEAVEVVHSEVGAETWYQKKCYHCQSSFVTKRSNAMGCTHDHANTISRCVKNNGMPKFAFSIKPKEKVDFSIKKYDQKMGAMKKEEKAFVERDPVEQRLVKTMKAILLEDGEDQQSLGMASPTWEHSDIMRNVVVNFYNRHYADGINALPEMAMIPSDNSSPRADVGFLYNGRFDVMLEIMKDKQFRTKDEKLKRTSCTTWYKIKEYIIYIYDTKEWYMWDGERLIKDVSKSTILGIDLADYIELPK